MRGSMNAKFTNFVAYCCEETVVWEVIVMGTACKD